MTRKKITFFKPGQSKWPVVLMLILLTVEASFLYIQAGKAFRTMSAEDLDLASFIILLITNIAWIFYGYFIVQDIPLMVSGALYAIGAVLILIVIFMYGDEDESTSAMNI